MQESVWPQCHRQRRVQTVDSVCSDVSSCQLPLSTINSASARKSADKVKACGRWQMGGSFMQLPGRVLL
ncbi:hypothetical protein AGIG_G16388 [Arapaima gigas]